MVCRNARDESAAIDRWVFNYINYNYSWSCLSNCHPTGLAISSINRLAGWDHASRENNEDARHLNRSGFANHRLVSFGGVSKYANIILVVKASLGIKHQEIVCHCIPQLPFNPRTYKEGVRFSQYFENTIYQFTLRS